MQYGPIPPLWAIPYENLRDFEAEAVGVDTALMSPDGVVVLSKKT